jgi:hypothetical protein
MTRGRTCCNGVGPDLGNPHFPYEGFLLATPCQPGRWFPINAGQLKLSAERAPAGLCPGHTFRIGYVPGKAEALEGRHW